MQEILVCKVLQIEKIDFTKGIRFLDVSIFKCGFMIERVLASAVIQTRLIIVIS